MRAGFFNIYSELHDREKIELRKKDLLTRLAGKFEIVETPGLESEEFPIILVSILTGGSEEKFVEAWKNYNGNSLIVLLAFETDNSLPAALEIKTWLNRQAGQYIVPLIHGKIEAICEDIEKYFEVAKIKAELSCEKLGVIGAPSDWLIASKSDPEDFKKRFGIDIEPVRIEELNNLLNQLPESSQIVFKKRFASSENLAEISEKELLKAERIYRALKRIQTNYLFTAVTLRCFDILDSEKTTGCMALAALNDENVCAGCEADVPAAISMIIAQKVAKIPVFMANPSQIRGDEAVFAHCTVPCSILQQHSLDTHFESGIGLAIAGKFAGGPVTLFKIDNHARNYVVAEGQILRPGHDSNLCRTQIHTFFKGINEYLLQKPLGNHQIIIPGHHAKRIRLLMDFCGLKEAWNQPALP
jgi:L-fucose isomerase-like protein